MHVPPLVRLTTAVAWIEAAVLVGYAAAVLVMAARGDRSTVGSVAFLALLLAAWGLGLAAAGRAVLFHQRRGRSPIVRSQLFGLVVGVPVAQGGALIPGVMVAALAVAGLIGALSPQVTRWLTTVPS